MRAVATPESLHPALWRAAELGRQKAAVRATGFATLDAELPGGGWPHRELTELLLPHPGIGEMRLLASPLAAVAAAGRSVMLFDPPAALCGWALLQLGVDARQLLVVHGRAGARAPARQRLPAAADLLWAIEQALKSGHVGALLAWLPDSLRADALRRLQLAAQSHDGPVFLLRGIQARGRPSAAALRLALASAGVDRLALWLLKRRGPLRTEALHLDLPPVLAPSLRARAALGRATPAPAARVGTGEAKAVALPPLAR